MAHGSATCGCSVEAHVVEEHGIDWLQNIEIDYCDEHNKKATIQQLHVPEFERWIALVGSGKRVRVTLDWNDKQAVSVGKLVGLTEDGQGTVIGEDGFRHYVWPVLAVDVLDDNPPRST